MPGHSCSTTRRAKLKELIDARRARRRALVYGNRQNLGKIREDENALWSLGVHDLSVILYLIEEEIVESRRRTASAFLNKGVEDVVFCYLRFAAGKIAHMHLSWLDPHKMRRMTVVGREKMAVFDDMELEHKITVYDKRRSSRPRRTAMADRPATSSIPKPRTTEPLRLECQHFVRARAGGLGRRESRRRRSGRARARAAHESLAWRSSLRSTRPRSSIRGRCSGKA